jgi:Calcineurin-like phosphoesterase
MKEPDPLLTILHVSDLHIGEVDPASGDALVSPLAARLFSNLTWFDGVLGHHSRGLDDLHRFLIDMRKRDDHPVLVVSGDLTRVGGAIEFDNAADYLSVGLDKSPPLGNYVGLGFQSWRASSIPGNHDHWPGKPVVFGGPDPQLRPLERRDVRTNEVEGLRFARLARAGKHLGLTDGAPHRLQVRWCSMKLTSASSFTRR